MCQIRSNSKKATFWKKFAFLGGNPVEVHACRSQPWRIKAPRLQRFRDRRRGIFHSKVQKASDFQGFLRLSRDEAQLKPD
jgi:hypothetical protein